MILKKIKIMNYRQLESVELDMQESLTVLVGPNNSGKTTLISVLKGMFCDKKLGFSYSDIPISLSSMWLEKTVPVFQEIMLEYDKEKGVQKIIDEMTDNDKLSKDYTIDNFRAQIQVDYDPDSDNIQYFADYLMDLDDTKHSFYFIYTYEPSITAFEKGLNERYNRMAARVRDIENPGCIEKETKFYFLKEELLRIYCNAVIEKCYFCNSNYKNENSMEVAAFKSLFNFQNIPAMRELDDNESDSSKGISKRVIALLKDNDTWVEATKKLPDLLMADIEDSGAKKEIKNSSIKSLDDTIRDISKTSGGHIGKLQLEMDVKEQDVEEFIRRITRAIANVTNDEHIKQSNQYYTEKYGKLTEKAVRENLLEISYGETPFTSLYTGKLSHDDLLMFASKLIKRYPVLLKKIGDKYNYIFIDEYQDTSSYVLDIFYDAVKNRENVQIYLFGDRMQQIYRNYDGSFEGKLKEFDTSDRLEVNFRSIGKIVSILNNIYNDSSFEQQPTESNANVVPDIEPHVIISSNVPESIYKLQNKFPKILVLYLMNKEKYEEIGAKNLYDAYRSMEEYTFGRKYSSTDVLSDMSNDNPDILMKFLFLLNNVIGLYIDKNYGMVISICKKENKYFDSSQFKIKKHADKKSIKNKFDKIIEIYEKDGCLIKEVIESLFDNGFIPEKVKNDFEENIEYQKVLDIEMKEVSNLANFLSMPHISTQHGVKGESHTSVIFVASDNVNTPNVRMYPFFELWSKLEFSLPQFEELFYSYSKIIEEVEKELGMKVSKLTAETHNKNEKNKTILNKYSKQVLEKYQENLLFEALCKEDFITYLKKPNVKNVKKIFKITEIEGILTAYKLFYVGCSRARKNLIIII